MFLIISDVLSEAETAAAKQHLKGDIFQDGAATAGHHARSVKQNEQAEADQAAPVLKKVEAALLNHAVFKAAAKPHSIVKMMISRYRPGMAYGTHVDNAVIDGKRTDLAFTLFLNAPDTYNGGELVIEGHDGERSFKLPVGSLVLYPATTLHRVNEVTKGERLAVVGWIKSLIRDGDKRELLFDIDNLAASNISSDRAVVDLLHKVRANLMRMWIED